MKMLIVYNCGAFYATSQFSDIASVKGGWVIDTHDATMVLSTANGNKTVSQMLTEANAILQAIIVPSGYAYEIVQMIIANGNGNNAQAAIEGYCNGQKLITNFSSYSFRGARSIQSSNGNSIVNYSLFLPDHYFGTYSVSLNTGEITGYKKYENEKPQSGTTTYMRYNLWKKI